MREIKDFESESRLVVAIPVYAHYGGQVICCDSCLRLGQLQTLGVQTDTPDLIIPLMIPLIIRGMFCLLVVISRSLLAHYLMDN